MELVHIPTAAEQPDLIKGGIIEVNASGEGIDKKIALLFDIIQDETFTTTAQITDNWVDANYAVQDHIAIAPRTYRFRGLVGEVVYRKDENFLDFLTNGIDQAAHPVLSQNINKVATVVNTLGAISPVISSYTNSVLSALQSVNASLNRYKQLYYKLTGKNKYEGKRQQFAYQALQQALQGRLEVKIGKLFFEDETKENVIFHEGRHDCRYFLTSVSAHQGDNAFISDIEVTIKEVRIASTSLTSVDTSNFSGGIATQKATTATNGKANANSVNMPASAVEKAGQKFKDAAGKLFDPKNYTSPKATVGLFTDLAKAGKEYGGALLYKNTSDAGAW